MKSLPILEWLFILFIVQSSLVLVFYLTNSLTPVMIKIKEKFSSLIIANSQMLPRRYYETKLCVLFFTLAGLHNEKAIKKHILEEYK